MNMKPEDVRESVRLWLSLYRDGTLEIRFHPMLERVLKLLEREGMSAVQVRRCPLQVVEEVNR